MPKKPYLKKIATTDLGELGSELAKYHDEIGGFLDRYDAHVESSSFLVQEQEGQGLTIEFSIKATIQPKKAGGASK